MNTINYYRDDDLFLHYSIDRHPNDNSYPMHAHECCELFYFINGKGRYIIEGTEYTLEPGCLLVMRPSEAHKLYLDPSVPYERVAIEFSDRIIKKIDDEGFLLKAYYDRPLGRNNKYNSEDFPHSLHDYISGLCLSNLPQNAKRLNIITNLLAILNQINISYMKNSNNQLNKVKTDLVKDVIEYINSNLFDNLSISHLSEKFYVSPSHLGRVFKSSIGLPIAKYITVKRLLEAKGRIQNGVPTSVAARECGFSDYSAFYRAYKKKFNVSPTAKG